MNFSPARTRGCFLPLWREERSARRRAWDGGSPTYGRLAFEAFAFCSAEIAARIAVFA